MVVRKIDWKVPDSRQNVTMRNDPTRIDPMKLKLGKQRARHDPLGAYVALEPANHTLVMDSVYIFEGCYIGLPLPISAQAQVRNHQPWPVPPGGTTGEGKPGSWGGHAVPVVAYNVRGVTCVTWGALQPMTGSFGETYCEHAYAIVSPDYLTRKKTTPQGFNLQQLQADLQDLK